jgi:hypothetical protein
MLLVRIELVFEDEVEECDRVIQGIRSRLSWN